MYKISALNYLTVFLMESQSGFDVIRLDLRWWCCNIFFLDCLSKAMRLGGIASHARYIIPRSVAMHLKLAHPGRWYGTVYDKWRGSTFHSLILMFHVPSRERNNSNFRFHVSSTFSTRGSVINFKFNSIALKKSALPTVRLGYCTRTSSLFFFPAASRTMRPAKQSISSS
jgi:hypothetical protein